jgi:putative aminopeptidase FrvX
LSVFVHFVQNWPNFANMTLNEILTIQTVSGKEWRMFAFIVRQLKKQGVPFSVDASGNIYAQKGKGESFPCVVAHMDTVHPIVEDLSIIAVGDKLTGFNRVTMQQTGIGGDDKVGVYIALKCLQKYDCIKVAFFVDEERGCIGSYASDVSFFADCRFILQADRRGSTDFINNAGGVTLCSKKFKKAVGKLLPMYGYKFTTGLMTDVMALKKSGVNVSMANVSCGYHRPHSDDEWVSVSQVEKCLDLFCCIIENLTGNYPHTYVPAPVVVRTSPYYGHGYGSREYVDFWNKTWDSKYDSLSKTHIQPKLDLDITECDGCLNVAAVSYSSYFNCFLCAHCRKEWQ